MQKKKDDKPYRDYSDDSWFHKWFMPLFGNGCSPGCWWCFVAIALMMSAAVACAAHLFGI